MASPSKDRTAGLRSSEPTKASIVQRRGPFSLTKWALNSALTRATVTLCHSDGGQSLRPMVL